MAAGPAASRSRDAAAFVFAGLVFVVMLIAWRIPTQFNNFVLLADAWKHGRTWIAFPGDYIDSIPFHGRAYIVEAPMPALLLFPVVLVFGPATNQSICASVIGAFAVVAAWRLSRNVGLSTHETLVATAFMTFGTSLYSCSAVGDVWFLSQVCAVLFTFLALGETFGRRRVWLVAIWAASAALSRYPMAIVIPLYLAILWMRVPDKKTIDRFAVPLVPAFVGWALYNYSRFGTIIDPGFALFYRLMDPRSLVDARLFALGNVPMQLQAMFYAPPRLVAAAPWILPQSYGFGILFTSLPFAYAVFAGTSFNAIVLWIAALLTAMPSIAYYDTGGAQYGSRHALDFEPFLFALLAMALRRRPSKIASWVLIAFSAVSAYAGFVWVSQVR